jgi:GT2 family glycosyltransferase
MRIRAVVVNYNGGDEVVGSLRALLASEDVDLEVVAVDNGSVDGSAERIEAELPAVRVLRSPGNLGYPAINQVARDLSAIDALAIVNPDAVVEPHCLALLAEALEADPSLGATCPRILLDGAYREVTFHLDGPPRASLDLLSVTADRWHLTGPRVRRRWHRGVAWTVGDGSVLRTTSVEPVALTVQAHAPGRLVLTSGDARVELPVGRDRVRVEIRPDGDAVEIVQNAGSVIGRHGVGENRGYHRPDGPPYDRPLDVPAWCGAGVLLRSEYLRDVGLLDERWFLYYEDTDLAWRGLLRGWRYRYVPTAVVRHAHSTTIGHGSALYDVQHTRNRLLTVTKNAPARGVVAAWLDGLRLVVAQLRADVAARLRDHRPPEPTLTVRRLRALAAAARLTPGVLADRRRVRAAATVADDALPVLGRWREEA